jgi:N-acetylneuraminate lyase
MTQFHGIFPAVVTPLDSEGRLATVSFERLIERLDGHGVHGIYVCGSTGEGLLLTVERRKQVAELALKCLPAGKPVLLHVGAHRLEDAIELAKHASRIGIAAISSLPPHGDYTFAEIRYYYQLLAAASDLPLLVYYLPDLYPAVSTLSQILELCEIRNVIGLKLTSVDLSIVPVLKKQGAVVFNGRDDILVGGLLMGADGGIGSFYNLIPDLFVQVYALAKADQWTEARAVQERINELINITLRFPAFPAIKAMLSWSGIDCGEFLPPRRPLTTNEESELRALLSRSSFASSLLAGVAR